MKGKVSVRGLEAGGTYPKETEGRTTPRESSSPSARESPKPYVERKTVDLKKKKKKKRRGDFSLIPRVLPLC